MPTATDKNTEVIASNQLVSFQVQMFKESESKIKVPSEIHIIPLGRWSHSLYGEMVITSEDIKEFIANFDAKIRKDIRITAGHESFEELPAVAWIRSLSERADGLWAEVEWTSEGEQLLKDKKFKYFSPEYFPVYEDAATQQKYRNVLSGGALTNQPFFKELKDVVTFSDKSKMFLFNSESNINNDMNLEDILKKEASELTAEESAFLVGNADSLSDEDKTKFESVLADGADDGGEDEGGDEEGGDDDGGEGDDEGGEEQQHSESTGMVQVSASELATLRTQANAGFEAAQKVTRMELSEKVKAHTFSSSNQNGHFAPKQEKSVVDFMFTLSEKQRDQFINVVNNMPKAAASFSEKGDDGKPTEVNARQELSELAAQKVKEASKNNQVLKYSDAVQEVLSERPDLKETN